MTVELRRSLDQIKKLNPEQNTAMAVAYGLASEFCSNKYSAEEEDLIYRTMMAIKEYQDMLRDFNLMQL